MTDPLLEGCWICGDPDIVTPDSEYDLCARCNNLRNTANRAPVTVVTTVISASSENLEVCWRCRQHEVSITDELGLCPSCIEYLRVDDDALPPNLSR